MPIDFIDELAWRGLYHQCTDEAGLRKHLSTGTRRAYVGFDPTADSLTIGNLVLIMLLVHLQRAGHTPVVVMGGGTGLIGDPSGKSAERPLMTAETVAGNVTSQRRIFENMWSNAPRLVNETDEWPSPNVVDNADWLCHLSYVDVLRDIGKHFSVNMMIQKDSVRERLTGREQGISYTEFSYMILQAYDFEHLFRNDGVTVQMGGSDQWGNIVAGCDLIRRQQITIDARSILPEQVTAVSGDPSLPSTRELAAQVGAGHVVDPAMRAFGLTAPLVEKADGGKFGKTESGAIWLTPERTSPYAFFQFWLNTDDADLEKFLKLYTLMPQSRIGELMDLHQQNPGERAAHRELARHVTALIHGPAEAEQADAASRALFSGDIAGLPAGTLDDVFANVPSSEHEKADLDGEGLSLVDFLPRTTLAKSKRESREFLGNGSVSVNGRKVGIDHRLTRSDLLHDRLIAIRRGKKSWHVTRWGEVTK